jgi:type I restriction enzyme M protein
VLFIDARNIYQQIDRAHRDFRLDQLEFLGNIVRLYRGLDIEDNFGSDELIDEYFPKKRYQNINGLCKVSTLDEIEAQGWSLNPGRYVGVAELDDDGIDFYMRLKELNEKLELLNDESIELHNKISNNLAKLLHGA